MWTIVLMLDNGKTKVLESIGEDAEAVAKYKEIVENRHKPGGTGNNPVYLHWVEF